MIKDDLKQNCKEYDHVISKSTLKENVYGISTRANMDGAYESTREPECELSILDDCCFNFYVLKYCEHFGVAPLISILANRPTNKISYH